MKFADLVDVSQLVAATPKRTAKVELLAGLLGVLDETESLAAVGMLVGVPRQGRFGVGWATLGDITSTPASVASLTITDVDRCFDDLAAMSGEGSQRERGARLIALYQMATTAEQRHIHLLLTGELRQGASEGVLGDAVAKAAGLPVADLRRAAMLLGDLGAAAVRALSGQSLADVGLTPLIGVQPMLAATATSISEALALTGPASVEWKLDGARVQVHRSGSDIRVFTRNLNEVTDGLPSVVDAALAIPGGDFVLDGEALGLGADGRPLKFQDTMSAEARLHPFFFDVLYAAGEQLIDQPLSQRKQLLADLVPAALLLPTLNTIDVTEAEAFGAAALAAGHEGVMVKALDSNYQAGRRGATWRKVKPVHTLDLVVLAAEWGHGRRTGWLSNLHHEGSRARCAGQDSGGDRCRHVAVPRGARHC